MGSYGWIRYPKGIVVLENPLAIFGLGELFFYRCISYIPRSLRHVKMDQVGIPKTPFGFILRTSIFLFFQSRGAFLSFTHPLKQSLPLPPSPTHTKPPFHSPRTSTQNNHLTLPSPYTCSLSTHIPYPLPPPLPPITSHPSAIPSPNLPPVPKPPSTYPTPKFF